MKYHPSHLSIRISADIAFVITTLDPLPCSPIRWISLCRLQIQRDATLCNSFQISCHTASHIMRPPSPYVLTNAGRPSLSAIFRPLRQLPPVCCFFHNSIYQPSAFRHPESCLKQPRLLVPPPLPRQRPPALPLLPSGMLLSAATTSTLDSADPRDQ